MEGLIKIKNKIPPKTELEEGNKNKNEGANSRKSKTKFAEIIKEKSKNFNIF